MSTPSCTRVGIVAWSQRARDAAGREATLSTRLAAWASSFAPPDTKVVVARGARAHAEVAQAWHGVAPVLHDVTPTHPAEVELLADSRLESYAQALRGMAAEYETWLDECTLHADGPLRAVVEAALAVAREQAEAVGRTSTSLPPS